MDKKFAIFDFDGTVVDSMWMWNSFGLEFLDKYGAKYRRTEILKEIEKLNLSEAAKLFVDGFFLDISVEQAVDEMNNIVYKHYEKDIPVKEGISELLESLRMSNTRMCIVSVTEESIIKLCLDRLGILDCFEFILSCENMGLSKREPTIYLKAAERFNAKPNEIAVYEDMPHTIKTAKTAGFYTIGVYDNQSDEIWNCICDLADDTIDYTKEVKNTVKTALTIAGSDCSGGAGIQADIKTMTTNGVYAMSAITALTAQNTMGVNNIMEVTPQFLKEQLDAIFTDIFPDAAKIGMVASADLINVIAERLSFYKAQHIVVDPVMVATSGARLINEDAISVLKDKLLPLAYLVTPNIPEAEMLSEMTIHNKEDMLKSAKIIKETYGCNVLLKGGHSTSDADDLLLFEDGEEWFCGRRINNPNTHGTGCTLSSAIASNLAKGFDIKETVKRSKEYISRALSAMLNLGHGSGPVNHAFNLND